MIADDREDYTDRAVLDFEDLPRRAGMFALTDLGNGEYFAARDGDDVRFDHRRGRWLLWRDHFWEPDTDEAIRRRATDAMRHRLREAADLDDEGTRARAVKWAIGCESRSRIESLLWFAQALDPITDRGDDWDTGPDVLGSPTGVVDLHTAVLRDGHRDDRITLQTAVPYDPAATSALWDHALHTILPDEATRAFFHVAIGYSATGDTREDRWFLANGSGRNGKGTLLQPIRHALGTYALELPGAVFDARCDRPPYELAMLPGKRFVTSSESGDSLRLHHDRVKQLTGGDSVSASNKYEKAFEFDPCAKLWLSCNTRPYVTDDTAAFWSRVLLIPFTQSFAGIEDRTLRPALIEDPVHQAAILAWIVRGAVRYYCEGLTPPAAVRDATDEYQRDSDPLAAFLTEACEREPTADVRASELYEHYRRWAERANLTERERLTVTKFGRKMSARFDTEHRVCGKVYRGVARTGC